MRDGIYIGNEDDAKLFCLSHVRYDKDVTLSKVVNGRIKFAMYITGITGEFASIHVSGKGIRRDEHFLRTCFDYVYNALRIKKLISVVHSDNRLSMRFTEYCGAVPVQVINSGDQFITVYEMTAEQCRFI